MLNPIIINRRGQTWLKKRVKFLLLGYDK